MFSEQQPLRSSAVTHSAFLCEGQSWGQHRPPRHPSRSALLPRRPAQPLEAVSLFLPEVLSAAWPSWLLGSHFLHYLLLAFGANRQIFESQNLLFLHPWGPWRKKWFLLQGVRNNWDPDLPALRLFAPFPGNGTECVVGLLCGAGGCYWGQSDSDSSRGVISLLCQVPPPLP